MKILWIVNMMLPELAKHLGKKTGSSGTWMEDLSQKVAEDEQIELAVACISGKEFLDVVVGSIRYFVIPGNGKTMLFYTKRLEKEWEKVYNSFKPDIVHLHGTEYSHGLAFLRTFPQVKAVASIQGVINRIKDVDLGGLSFWEALSNRTLRENLKLNGMLEMRVLHKKNAKHEREILTRLKYANHLTFWDFSMIKSINPKIECFPLSYNLRDAFYHAPKWDIDRINRHSIFTNPGGTPLKGLHNLLKAVAIVKETYPDVMVHVPGFKSKDGILQVNSGYSKYIHKLIDRLDLKNSIRFLGTQTCEQMIENIQKSHMVVLPSAIEGLSLILQEAMFIGTPCITSFRGGMADYISDKKDGFLYDFQEYPYLAYRIMELFENDNLCNKFSKNGIKRAEITHNREKNPQECIQMYHQIDRA